MMSRLLKQAFISVSCLALCAVAVAADNETTDDMKGAAVAKDLAEIRQLQRQAIKNGSAPPHFTVNGQKTMVLQNNGRQPTAQQNKVMAQLNGQTPRQQVQEAKQPVNIDEQAFGAMASNLLPLTPKQIHRLKQMFAATKAAADAPAGAPPKPVATSQFVNLAPGATPPVIRLTQGFVSSVVFLDSTGGAWPIVSYDLGNPKAFNIAWNQKDNTLMIQALSAHQYANLAVRLKGLTSPVMLSLIPGQKVVDYRVDLRVQGHGPNAVAGPMGDQLPESASNALLGVLNGASPTGGRSLDLNGPGVTAWLVGDKMFVRTRYTILSPSWLASLSSADGMHVYKMQPASLLLMSMHGKIMQLKVRGF